MSATYDEIEEAFDNGDFDTTYPPSVYEAYCEYQELDIEELVENNSTHAGNIADYYIGHYDDREDFILEGLGIEVDIHSYLVVDYDASWERNFRHEYFERNGQYFAQF